MTGEDDINQTIAIRLKALRLSKKISVDDMAKALGVTPHIVTRIENRTSAITVPMLVPASRRLGVLTGVIIGEIPANAQNGGGNAGQQ